MASSGHAVPAFLRTAAHPLRWRLLTELARSDLRVRELVTLLGEPQNLVSYHLRLLRDAGLVTTVRSSFDRRDSYYHLDVDRCTDALAEAGTSLHPALSRTPAPRISLQAPARPGVLFVCTGNRARSPIAEALLRLRTAGRVLVTSAGTRPGPDLDPDAVRVLRDDFGVDIAGRRPRHVDTVTAHRFDVVITLCDRAREVCPDFPSQPQRVHWSIPDPAGDADQTDDVTIRHIATDIDTRVRHLSPVLTVPQSAKESP
jgi:protein-tyrosine-phosphatase/DNA-binding transcriptional ArsR family regulator